MVTATKLWMDSTARDIFELDEGEELTLWNIFHKATGIEYKDIAFLDNTVSSSSGPDGRGFILRNPHKIADSLELLNIFKINVVQENVISINFYYSKDDPQAQFIMSLIEHLPSRLGWSTPNTYGPG